ncbi:MAG TPA: 4-(cytidine 5'-diphospho)-2-C-methyl-D-erythritol kinase [Terriglobia bacterium]|nr:4-(cytidine 5'-diphospho)-2-C-methyl-D-erythritol kinase [Terriglobia bacterium]
MKNRICLRAFAKINLGLKILDRRPDGYHSIRTVYQTVALHDRLEIVLLKRAKGIRVECDHPDLPSGRDNLVYRACQLWKRARVFSGGIHVRLEKRIPAGSGLGGASSDAAAALLGLEHLTGDRMSLHSRWRLSAHLGSDVPFFLWGGRGLGVGRGEEVFPLPDLPRRRCLVVFPGFHVSTPDAYREAGRELTKTKRGRTISSFGAWSPLPLESWGPAENDFERVVFARWPGLARLKSQLIRAGAEAASLTGSGSAVYALFDSARTLARATKLVPGEWQVFRTRTLSRAEYQRLLFV